MEYYNEYLNIEGVDDFKQFCLEKGEVRQVRKNEILSHQGQRYRHLGYIDKGCFRYISYTSDGASRTVGYSFEKDYVIDYISFIGNSPLVADIQAIEDSTLYSVTYGDLSSFFEKYSTTNIRQKIAELFCLNLYSRMLSLYCDSPEERYSKLIRSYPAILEKVSLKDIASYINVTPETLSRIRNKLVRNS